MQITEIRVSWTETASLGNYSNVKPSLSLTATLDEGDDPSLVRQELLSECQGYVREMVDQALEADGQPAKYSTAPRYDILASTFRAPPAPAQKIVLLVPTGTASIIAGEQFYRAVKRFRYPAALREIERGRSDDADSDLRVLVFDCSDGDLDRAIPAIQIAKAAEEAYDAERRRQEEERRAAWQRHDADRRLVQQADDEEDDRADEDDDSEDDDPAAVADQHGAPAERVAPF